MLGALITAGAGLLSSLFGSKSKKETTTNTVDYARMVRDAEAAGFNPLTALRNGGAAGFTTSTTGATPFGARLADGVAGAAQDFFANFDPFADKRKEQEARLVEAQIANLGASTAQMNRVGLGSVPTYTAGQQKRKFGSTVAKGQTFKSVADALPASAGDPQTPTVEKPTVTNPYPTDSGIRINANMPDAATYEQRYGEPGSWGGGLVTFGGDIVSTASEKYGEHKSLMRKRRAKKYPLLAGVDDLGRIPRKYSAPWR